MAPLLVVKFTAVPGGTGLPKRSATNAVMWFFKPKVTRPEMLLNSRARLKFGCEGGPPRTLTAVERTVMGGETEVICAVTWILIERSPLVRVARTFPSGSLV